MSVRDVVGLAILSAWLAATIVVFASGPALAADANALVSASSIHSDSYLAEYAIDGDAQTRWASDGFSGKPECPQIDFGKPLPVENLVVHWERAYAVQYQIQISGDGRNWQTLHEKQDGKGGKEVISGLSGKGRYLRVLCLRPGPYGLFSIWEIEFPDNEVVQAVAEAKRRAAEVRRKAQIEARRRLSQIPAEYGVQEIIFALRQPGKDGHWYANFGYYADDEDRLTYGNGGVLRRLKLATGEATTILEDREGAVRDPVVHYDAQKILFSYRKGRSPYYGSSQKN